MTKSETVIETGGCIFLSSYLLSPSGPYIEVVKSDIYELRVSINVGFGTSICFSTILVYINILVFTLIILIPLNNSMFLESIY